MTLANGLAGVDERSAALRTPLVGLGRTVEALLRGAQRNRAQLEAVATARLNLERRRRGVERCLRFSETLLEAERLLDAAGSGNGGGGSGGGGAREAALLAADELPPPSPWKREQPSGTRAKDLAPVPMAGLLENAAAEEGGVGSGSGSTGGEVVAAEDNVLADEEEPDYDDGALDDGDLGKDQGGPTGASATTAAHVSECSVLERCAHASLRLLAELRAADAHEHDGTQRMHALAQRARNLHSSVLGQLTAAFVAAVTPPDQFAYAQGQTHAVHAGSLAPVLRALASLDRGAELERHYGSLVLQPFVHATFTTGRLDSGGSRGSCRGLAALYGATLTYVKAACGATLQLNEELFGGNGDSSRSEPTLKDVANDTGGAVAAAAVVDPPRGNTVAVDLLVKGVWAHLAAALVARLGDGLFGALAQGFPDTTHATYSATERFLRDLEVVVLPPALQASDDDDDDDDSSSSSGSKESSSSSSNYSVADEHGSGDRNGSGSGLPGTKMKTSKEQLRQRAAMRRAVRSRLQSHPSTADLWRRWNLPVYFKLRYAELTASVDDALTVALKQAALTGTLPRTAAIPSATTTTKGNDEASIAAVEAPALPGATTTTTSSSGGGGEQRGFELAVVHACASAIGRCFRTRDVFLRPLAPKFLKLAMAMVAKLTSWLQAAAQGQLTAPSADANPVKAPIPPAAAVNGKPATAVEGTGASANSAAASIVASPAVVKPGDTWTPPAEDLATVAEDASRLARWLTHELADHVARLVEPEGIDEAEAVNDDGTCVDNTNGSSSGSRASELVRKAFTSAAAPLEVLAANCWERVAAAVANLCCAELAAVRGVTAVYRMTNKPPPVSPSPFVAGLLQPLQAFEAAWEQRYAEGGNASGNNDSNRNGHAESGAIATTEGGNSWKRSALALVVARYQVVVVEVLGQVRTMDEALKKRKKAKGGAAASGGDGGNEKLSDAEKIGLQLWLDSEKFGEALASHGLPPQESPPFVELQAELKPFAKFRGAAS